MKEEKGLVPSNMGSNGLPASLKHLGSFLPPARLEMADRLLENLEEHLNIHTVQQILRSSGLVSARSWTELKTLIKTGVKQKPELIDTLLNATRMQQACDLKAVSFYELESQDASLIQDKMRDVDVPVSSFASAYPFLVSKADLEADDGKLKVIAKFSDEFGCGVVLSRKRRFTFNVDISKESFNSTLEKEFPDAEKIIAVKSVLRQTFDVLYVNAANSMLEVRADITRENGLLQTLGQANASVSDLKSAAGNLISKWVQGLNLGRPINLLPLAKKVYNDRSGAIKKLGFATDTDSIKRETMKAGVDLREELFHKNGAVAIDHKMDIFEIAIQWHGSDVVGGVSGSKPELHIPGSYRDYVKENARTDYLFVKGVRTYADANFILNKLKSYK